MAVRLPEGRSSSDSAREIMLAAAAAAAASQSPLSVSAPLALKAEKDWRWGYAKHFVANAALSAQSPAAALAIAQAGLQKAKEEFLLGTTPLGQVPISSTSSPEHTIFESRLIEGRGKPGRGGLSVPIGGKMLSGPALLAQLKSWTDRGIIEPSAAAALARVSQNKEWTDLRGMLECTSVYT